MIDHIITWIFPSVLVATFVVLPILWVYDQIQNARAQWQAIPLPERNARRASRGALGLLACMFFGSFVWHLPHGGLLLAIAAGMSLLYLVVGLRGSAGQPFDFMSAFWWGVGAIAAVVFLLKVPV